MGAVMCLQILSLTGSRHVTAPAMPNAARPEITCAMVEELWDEALESRRPMPSINRRAEAMLMQVNAESPVVNWGLTELYHLTLAAETTINDLARSRARWLTEVARYEADPALWMRKYFQDMVCDFATRHGLHRGRAFAAKLVRNGYLTHLDLPVELRR
jgi:hypothetical protein